MEKMNAAITIESTSSGSTSGSASTLPTLSTSGRVDAVRVLKISEHKAAAQCLADAFATDAVAMYFIETPDRASKSAAANWKLHVNILEYIVAAHCMKGLALTVGPDYDCVALWMPPGQNMDDLCTILRSGMWRLQYQLSPEGKTRFFKEFLPLLHDTKAEVLGARDPQSWYLVYIGTKQSARGKGYARKLIEYVGQMADTEGRPCYLESSNDVNPIIYGKLGFEMKKTIQLCRAPDPIELDIMVREPVVGEGK
ncbi:hypothetical protein MMC19_002338, partial [Ptychographa xylographoides]|nr:hypothetical protein [Ptychographa xylographoides]